MPNEDEVVVKINTLTLYNELIDQGFSPHEARDIVDVVIMIKIEG